MNSSDEYTVERVIGEGSYGRALLCREKATDELIVVKEISFANLTEFEKEESRKETHILSLLHHPNIIGYRGSFVEKNIFHIVMEYADGSDLGEKISNQTEPFKEDQILDWFVQICLAIKHIHDRKILHRDLKTQNIFMMKNGIIKLGDFGISKILDHTTSFAKTAIGTPYYLSPEICEGKPYNAKSDIWALGCILYEICTFKHPFDSNCINGLVIKIIRSKPAPIPKIYSSHLKALIDACLQKSPSKRPSINQILNIPYVHDRIGHLLSQTLEKIEFSHTIFHGVKGGETPDIISDQPSSKVPKSKLAIKKARLQTKPLPKSSAARQKKFVSKEELVQQKKKAIISEREQMKLDRQKKLQEEQRYNQEQAKKRQEILEKQRQRKLEREQWMAQLKKEEKETRKHLESLDAPFKKVRSMAGKNTQSSDSQCTTKEEQPKSQSQSEEQPSQSKESLDNDDNDNLFSDDFISDDESSDDLVNLAAVAADINENPPEDENSDDDTEKPTQFNFRGEALKISEDAPRPQRNEEVRAFIEKNLGAQKLLNAYKLIRDESSTLNEDEFDAKLSKILTDDKEMDFYPLIQQLIVSELSEEQ